MLDLLSLGLDAIGLLGASRRDRAQQALYKKQLAQAQNQFDQQMDHSVRRRMEDAKRAGVHPLFAMGASVGASPTLTAGGQPPTGSAVGDAISALADRIGQIELNKAGAERDRAAAKRDEAEAAYLNSRRATLASDLASRGRDGVKTYPYGTKRVETPIEYGPEGKATFFPPEIPQHGSNPGIVAGTRPGEVKIRLGDGSTARIYDPDLGLDEIGQVYYAWQRVLHYDRKASKWTKDQLRKAWNHAKDVAGVIGRRRESSWPRN